MQWHELYPQGMVRAIVMAFRNNEGFINRTKVYACLIFVTKNGFSYWLYLKSQLYSANVTAKLVHIKCSSQDVAQISCATSLFFLFFSSFLFHYAAQASPCRNTSIKLTISRQTDPVQLKAGLNRGLYKQWQVQVKKLGVTFPLCEKCVDSL